LGLLLASTVFVRAAAAQQPAFAVATIRPSAAEVQFDRDGKTEISAGMLHMQDVTVRTCIKWAYGVQESQITGPDWMRSEHFDIVAKADGPANSDAMKQMMQALLAERFKLGFHRENKESKAFVMTVAKGGAKLHLVTEEGKSSRQNTATGTIAKSTTMQEFADFIAGPLQTPVVDETGLTGKFDFVLDFTTYLPEGERAMKAEMTNIIVAALQGELGLKLEPRKVPVQVMVVDHVESRRRISSRGLRIRSSGD
jgi:uncharacterized protein (TIGR03435 family)